jgi:glycosyltransferase involved in cell wall biosynthesis
MKSEEIAVIIPALDEERALPGLLEDLAELELIRSTIVVDNGSRDATPRLAESAGAIVVREPRRGYGAACLRGLEVAGRRLASSSIVVFLDADRSDDPCHIAELIRPIREGRCDLVLGSRTTGGAEPGSLLPHQRAGTFLICLMIWLLFGRRYTDLGPFRAVRLDALRGLSMKDTTFGWTAEMQVKAVQKGLRVLEIPVTYRRRVGRSKISGTLGGTARAALKIGWTLAALKLRGR